MAPGVVSEAGAGELWRTSLGLVSMGSASGDVSENNRLSTLGPLLGAFDDESSRLRVVE
jgi:hypothetical protein